LKILYDNEAKEGFESGWGFSCLIEHGSRKLLFDTGWDSNVLLRNMKKFDIRPEQIKTIVLSHSHWDHTGGLNNVLHREATVYVPSAFTKHMKEEIEKRAALVQVTQPQRITDNIFTLGELGGDFKEQSLALKLDRGVFILTGCAHPGLGNILEAAKELGDLYGVMGGFHGFEAIHDLEKFSQIVPCHCTTRKKEILEMYPKTSEMGMAGLVLDLDGQEARS